MGARALYRWLIGDGHFEDPESRDKALVMGIGLPIAVLVSVLMGVLYALEGEWAELPIPGAVGLSFAFNLFGWLRWRSFELVTHVMAGSMTVVFAASALHHADASYLALLAVVPVSAAFYASPRVGVLWAVLSVAASVATATGLVVLHPAGPWQPGAPVPYLARYVLAVFVLAAMASAFQFSRARTFRRIEEARALAEAHSRAKSRFLATISHDLRTPLNGILGTLELTRQHADLPAAVREDLQTISESGGTLLALINDLLDLSRAEAGRLEITPGPFDPRAAVEQVVRLHEPRAAAAGLRLSAQHTWEGERRLVGDVVRLQQVLHNLVGNAVKFTERGEIEVSTALAPGDAPRAWRLALSVRDTGRGISDGQLATLFAPFRQVHATDAALGSGLGLTISRALVEQMGGRLEVESKPGRGSTFTVTLELPEAEGAAAAPKLETAPEGPLRGRVLVVDDNAINRKVAAALLTRLGLEVDVAESGRQALERLEGATVDLVLMDLQMPELDGAATTRALRKREGASRHTPIIALTASALPEELASCLDAGMDATLTKPLQLAQLRQALAPWLKAA